MIQNFNKTHNTNYPYQHPHIQHARANLDNNNNRKYNNNNWQGQHHYKINHKINHNNNNSNNNNNNNNKCNKFQYNNQLQDMVYWMNCARLKYGAKADKYIMNNLFNNPPPTWPQYHHLQRTKVSSKIKSIIFFK
jgi:hypothetical protein